jgi:hypothetical protein
MSAAQTATIVIIVLVGVAVLLYAFAMFDRLVRAQYEQYREAWVADGRPRGFLWRVPECTWWRSGLALGRLSSVWLFKTPAWAAQSGILRGWFRQLRVCVLAWNAIVVGLLIFVIASWK